MKNRTGFDFSEHEVIISKSEGLLVHHLKKPNTKMHSIKYINTNGILAVTGDYGNWIFCREFHPDADNYVSDGYWCEKLTISSTQDCMIYDPESTRKELLDRLNGGLEEYGYTGSKLEQMIEYTQVCLDNVDNNELDYAYVAYREIPYWEDYECAILHKRVVPRLQFVFDGFDEICGRMKSEQNKIDKNS